MPEHKEFFALVASFASDVSALLAILTLDDSKVDIREADVGGLPRAVIELRPNNNDPNGKVVGVSVGGAWHAGWLAWLRERVYDLEMMYQAVGYMVEIRRTRDSDARPEYLYGDTLLAALELAVRAVAGES